MSSITFLALSDFFFTCKFVTVRRDFEESNFSKACKMDKTKNK